MFIPSDSESGLLLCAGFLSTVANALRGKCHEIHATLPGMCTAVCKFITIFRERQNRTMKRICFAFTARSWNGFVTPSFHAQRPSFVRHQFPVPQALHLFVFCEQDVKGAFRVNAPVFQHDNMVGAAQSGFPVRNHQAGAVALLE